MQKSTIAIVILWVYTIVGNIWAAFAPEQSNQAQFVSTKFPLIVQLLPIPFFAVMAFRAPHSPFFNVRIAEFVDSKFGLLAFESFLVRLKPLLLFGVSSLLNAAGEVMHCLQQGEPMREGVNVFFLAGGVGFVLAHIILRSRAVRGV